MDTNKKYHGGQAVYVSVNLQKVSVLSIFFHGFDGLLISLIQSSF